MFIHIRSFPDDLAIKATTNLVSSHAKSASQSSINVKPAAPVPKAVVRSLTQEINIEDIPKAKASSSESNLRPTPIRENPADVPRKAVSIEDDICSTDSSLIEDGDGKKKKRKLFNFSKKSKKGEKS